MPSNYVLVNFTHEAVEDLVAGEISEENLIATYIKGIEMGKAQDNVHLYRKEPLEKLYPTAVPTPEATPETRGRRDQQHRGSE